MDFASNPEFSFSSYLLGCFALGLLLSAKCLMQMAFPQYRTPRWLEAIAGLATFVLTVGLDLDALGDDGVLAAAVPVSAAFLTLSLGATLVAAHLNVSWLHSRGRQLATQPVAWLAVALLLAATARSSERYSAGNLKVEIQKSKFFVGGGELHSVREFVAVTDRGREVELFRWVQDDGARPAATDQPALEISPANCHGWVFTGGEYFLWSDGVERILEDNGYELCQTPQPGDLIVYRNSFGGISHTGLVKAAFLGGSPIIESKWGLGGLFVHPVDEQPYGNSYSFYRSARQGHALAIFSARR